MTERPIQPFCLASCFSFISKISASEAQISKRLKSTYCSSGNQFFSILFIMLVASVPLSAQSKKYYWQQQIGYKMDVHVDVNSNKFTGTQIIRYKNNSPDVLDHVYFHLYLNAFQPGSAMDVRSRTISDPDPRVGARIQQLKPDEIGYHHIKKLTQNGIPLQHETNSTILEVKLAKPLRPGQSAKFEMEYEAQVPVQVRRNGRDNKEGIRYSMAQWYPKMCEYDKYGWHAQPYIGREFYGVWGDFDVSITIDKNYVVAASGLLQNSRDIGHGYAPEPARKPELLTWHFIADNVHDFVWAADPDYIHRIHQCKNGTALHTFYQETPDYKVNWEALPAIMEEALEFVNSNFGKFPYPTYSFIQGGDGGMEYPMATLVTGNRSLVSLVGVSVHEFMHSWYQMVLGFDESLYAWMDEGFTDYAETRVMEHLKMEKLIPGEPREFPYEDTYKTYKSLVDRGIEEPLSTHADHFEYNTAYSIAAYVKGSLFLHQLEYVIGTPAVNKGLLEFFNAWKFRHPDMHDFIRTMEKTSGLELDWYKEFMVYSIKTIDYAIDTVYSMNQNTLISIRRVGKFPMPVDVYVSLKNGTSLTYSIPLDIMRGAKKEIPYKSEQLVILSDWQWVNPTYDVVLPYRMDDILSVTIDPSQRMADLVKENNSWPGE